ncbi:AAA family ATPase [Mycolicibacterium sp.]|uniref:AAA family ATPase n=1 Tax=Mycolicibacterium sp. TaxID=2320850 RepID=UPI0037C80F08
MAERDNPSTDDLEDADLPSDITHAARMPRVRKISVESLFGRYSYVLDAPVVDDRISRLMLLHGDNGSGKTTILKLAWHLLSTAELKGHKSAIARTPFSSFSVEFEDGRRFSVHKSDGLIGAFDLIVEGPQLRERIVASFTVNEKLDVSYTPDYGVNISKDFDIELARQWTLIMDERSGVGKVVTEEPGKAGEVDINDSNASPIRRAMTFLKQLEVMPMLLGDDRQLHSDNKAATKGSRKQQESSPSERVAEELETALSRVNSWLRSLTISAQRSGSSEEASIYLNVLRNIRDQGSHAAPDHVFQQVEETIDELAKRVPDFAEFDLITEFNPEEVRRLVSSVKEANRFAAYATIEPYLESMRARFDALTDAERLIRLITTHANRFLNDKRLIYSPQRGLRVVTDELSVRTLRPSSLSSGERQMLLLLCNALLARVERTLFLIDEPELSLGVPWQRQILTSLLEITEGTDVQFIVATHSIEMITANASSLVRLVNSVG